ncbi:MAG: 50S ribosomal protein L4 [Nitrospirae bacterium]|nr:50S ribosomal protein L4 [Nitrospirota bacterium]
MPEVDILNKEKKAIGKIDLPAELFEVPVNKGLLHEAVRNYLANQRQGTAATKTKGLVSGGGKKPWKQKHTGRARAGSNRSPLWRGGGIVFGPQPRDYSYRLPKKVKWAALNSALSAKFSDGEVIIIDTLNIDEPKTKKLVSLLKGFGLGDNKVLIIIPDKENNLELAARNMPNVAVSRIGCLNTYDILAHQKLLITKAALEHMKEVYA